MKRCNCSTYLNRFKCNASICGSFFIRILKWDTRWYASRRNITPYMHESKTKWQLCNNNVVNLSEYVANIKCELTTAILCLRSAWHDDDDVELGTINDKSWDKSYVLMDRNFKRGDNPKIYVYLSRWGIGYALIS